MKKKNVGEEKYYVKNDNAIEVGDCVQLKSGSPKMTVNRIDFDGKINRNLAYCVWYNDVTFKFESEFFELPTLKKV